MKLINKDALVAEIERKINKEIQSCATDSILGYSQGCVDSMRNVLSFLDTLEVKEVKEEPVSNDLEEAIGQSFIYHENRGDDFRSDKQIETAYRHGFESGFKYKESTSIIENMEKQNLEMNVADLEEEITLWANAIPEIRLDDVERIAKHFFELGLKTKG